LYLAATVDPEPAVIARDGSRMFEKGVACRPPAHVALRQPVTLGLKRVHRQDNRQPRPYQSLGLFWKLLETFITSGVFEDRSALFCVSRFGDFACLSLDGGVDTLEMKGRALTIVNPFNGVAIALFAHDEPTTAV
jgi:hypothetical protein